MILKEVVDSIKNEQILLPSFQREFVWDVKAQRSLIASVISNVPCTSSLLVDGTNTGSVKFLCKEIGSNLSQPYISINSGKTFNYLLDGQQRYSTLFNAFNDYYSEFVQISDRKLKLISLFEKLQYRWFLDFNLIKGDYFGFDSAKFDVIAAEKYMPDEIEEFIVFEKLNENGTEYFSINEQFDNLIFGCIQKCRLPLFLFFSKHSHRIGFILKSIQNMQLNKLFISNNIDQLKVRICNSDFSETELIEHLEIYNDLTISSQIRGESGKKITSQIDYFSEIWSSELTDFLKKQITNYNLNPIFLKDIDKAIVTYSHINTGGTSLSTLDLICAKSSTIDLRKQIIDSIDIKFKFIDKSFSVSDVVINENFEIITGNDGLQKNFADFFIQVLNIIHFKNNKKSINELPTNFSKQDYSLTHINDAFIKDNYVLAIEIVKKVSYFINIHCGQKKFKTVTNKLLLLPIASALIFIDKHDDKLIKRLIAFYWIKLFSGDYDSHQNVMSYNHCKDIVNWLLNKDCTIKDKLINELENDVMNKSGFSDKDSTCVKKPNRSLMENLMTYLLSIKSSFKDFSDPPKFIEINDKLHYHHLIPLAGASTIGSGTKYIRNKEHVLNVLMNMTPITDKSNIEIGRFNIKDYGNRLQVTNMDDHHINIKWKDITYDINNPTSKSDIKDLFENRHDKISSHMREKLKDYLN
jgi:hypothetical protein